MHLLVTGSNGFIGSAIVHAAHRHGWWVTGLGRHPGPKPINAAGDSWPDGYISADLTSPLRWNPEQQVDAVVHSAGMTAPWGSAEQYERINIGGTTHLLEWARAHGAPYFAFLSSTSVFARDVDQLGITENSPIIPDEEQLNWYSRSKAVGERLLERYPGKHAILRPPVVMGPGDPIMFPRLVEAAKAGKLPFFARPANNPVLVDLCDVDVVAEYTMRAVTRKVTGSFNLTNNEPVEFYPFLTDALGKLGLPAPAKRSSLAPMLAATKLAAVAANRLHSSKEEPMVTRFMISIMAWSKTFDISKTLAVLGKPFISQEESLARVIDWYHSSPQMTRGGY